MYTDEYISNYIMSLIGNQTEPQAPMVQIK